MEGKGPSRVLLGVHWVATLGAAVGSALFAVAWASDSVHVVSSYGFGSGPSRHSGYGTLAELVFLGLPAAGCFVVMGVATLALRKATRVVRRALWVTGGIAIAAGALFAMDLVIDVLNDRARAAEAEMDEKAARIAVDPVRQGAVPTEEDLTQAVRRGDPALVRALLGGARHLGGREALGAAFDAGDVAMLETLADSGAEVARALPTLIDPTKLAFHPGEVDWRALRAKWTAAPTRAVTNAVQAMGLGAPAGFPANEVDVVGVLTDLLRSNDVCFDPALTSAPIDAWMKDTALCTCNYCPYAVAIHWAFLASLYGDAIPALPQSKHVAMIRALARHVVLSKADEEPTVRMAVEGGNLFVLEVLESEGFDLHVVDGEFAEDHFYEPGRDRPKMKDHLARAGVTWRGSE